MARTAMYCDRSGFSGLPGLSWGVSCPCSRLKARLGQASKVVPHMAVFGARGIQEKERSLLAKTIRPDPMEGVRACVRVCRCESGTVNVSTYM